MGVRQRLHRVPTEEELADALATVDYTRVEVDGERGAVRIPQGTVLDLGGIAKGFIIHQATAILREAQVDRSMVNAGGDISVVGRRPDGRPWRVGCRIQRIPGASVMSCPWMTRAWSLPAITSAILW